MSFATADGGLSLALDPTVSAFVRILNCANSLTSMNLSFNRSEFSGDILSRMSQQIDIFPKLKSLFLSDMISPSDSFIMFLISFKESLKKLSLVRITINPGIWKDVFVFLSEEIKLTNLYMSDIVQGSQTVSFQNIHFERPIVDDYWYLEPRSWKDNTEFELINSFTFVKRSNAVEQLELEHGDGENIHEWMALIPDAYTLLQEPTTMIWPIF